ncbi:histone deacetylase [Piedraia hortae CBS 480.64]|uniref:Histone deacetylase n=1 Tax=Piedraia hortae CBS 480.64 TaxID=1314780 RepID=A0A6A7BWQ1_9PEZI|nr:histone deacetylase [Piedraia hortae CBS 480.64]
MAVRGSVIQEWSPAVPKHAIKPISSCGPREEPPMPEDDEIALREKELNTAIMRNVEELGITRPKGHKVSFHYQSGVENMHFGQSHPMKPWRLALTKHLVLAYGLQHAMDTYEAVAADKAQLCAFHDPDYIDFLSEVTSSNYEELCRQARYAAHIPPLQDGDSIELGPFNLSISPGADCPVFDGMSKFLFLYTGASLAAAQKLTSNTSDVVINWSGGLHHAHKADASGFCYINDIVLAILDLLRVYARVLYIDIDVHHGDGVEEAFQRQPRVMTLSFHRYGAYDNTGSKFFPGTGDITDIGLKGTMGERFAMNVPIGSGIDDRQYKYLFESITSRTIEAYKPQAIVLQCGADSLAGDRLGQFNLSIRQHGECVNYIKRFRIPLMLVGGGGYTPRNVARAWCYETAVATDNQDKLSERIPLELVPRPQAFMGRHKGEGKLLAQLPRTYQNCVKDADLELLIKKSAHNLRYVSMSPWVQMDQLPRESIMEKIWADRDQSMGPGKSERERRWKERDPAGRGELR